MYRDNMYYEKRGSLRDFVESFLEREIAVDKAIFGNSNMASIISNYSLLDMAFHLINPALLELGEALGEVLVWDWCGVGVFPGTSRKLVYSLTSFSALP